MDQFDRIVAGIERPQVSYAELVRMLGESNRAALAAQDEAFRLRGILASAGLPF